MLTDHEPHTPSNSLAQFSARSGALVAFEAQHERFVSDVDEVFRGIYTRCAIGPNELLAVCSAIAGEGRTTVGLGLAQSLALDFPERQVLLIETDMQRPAFAKDFNMAPAPGLLDYLAGNEPLELALRDTFLENLQVVPVGGPLANPSRLLRSHQMGSAMDTLRSAYDVIILDLPPLLLSSDAIVLADLVDGLVFVVRAGATSSTMVSRALDQIDHSKLRGVVLNGSQSAVPTWLRRLCGV